MRFIDGYDDVPALPTPVPAAATRGGPASGPRSADLASVAVEIADASRAAMVAALLDGTAWTVGELAHQAGVARSTGSEHVGRLRDAGLVEVARQGRHAYVTLAGPEVAEALSLIAAVVPPTRSLREQRADSLLAAGRTCYRHLAGRLGVELAHRLRAGDLVTPQWSLSAAGQEWFHERGVETKPDRRRGLLRPCIDWTQRRPHLAGPLADRLAARAFEQGWITRVSGRAVVLTEAGAARLGLES